VVGADGQLPLPWLRAGIDDVLARQRGHALLLHGAPGDGALEFALTLAQAWLCEGADASRPCGRCTSCRFVQSKTHPDLNVRMPEEMALALGWPVDVKEGRKPSRQIRIEEVRGAIDWIVTTPARGRAKVLVLYPAEVMNISAASALLKTLEEPPAGARVLICAAEPARLMATVRSRCQRVALPQPTAAQAAAWLEEQGVADAPVLLRAAGGRPLDALAMHSSGTTAAAWSALPARVAAGDSAALAGWTTAGAVDALMKLCHDAMVMAMGGEPRFFPAATLARSGHLPALDGWLRNLQRVRRHADHPWSEALLLDALVAEGREAFAVRPAAKGSDVAAFDTLVR
jgi:DNA polymerase III subunit delta'